jgi:Arm DNA-binding domain
MLSDPSGLSDSELAPAPRPRGINRLSAVAVKAFVRRSEPGKKLSDGAGLFLTVTKHGTASWRLAYAYGVTEHSNAATQEHFKSGHAVG